MDTRRRFLAKDRDDLIMLILTVNLITVFLCTTGAITYSYNIRIYYHYFSLLLGNIVVTHTHISWRSHIILVIISRKCIVSTWLFFYVITIKNILIYSRYVSDFYQIWYKLTLNYDLAKSWELSTNNIKVIG